MRKSPYYIYSLARELAGYVTEENKLLPVFASSNIEMYPYQIAAALFALRSPFLKGVILADEGSLGKTYEALLIAAQRWYEGRDRQLIILPTNLVHQWAAKIESGFTLPFVVVDCEASVAGCEQNPFDRDAIVVTTYDFALAKSDYISAVNWDLVIFDEASLLAKGYTGDNKTATVLKAATSGAFKLLLTPTPISISIMDVYGLLWFIDETILPDEKSFYARYFRKPENYHELADWVSQYCFRTLKSQVSGYVNFSQRVPYTVSYELSAAERALYDKLNSYLERPYKLAYPKMEQYDLTLMYHHTLSSSPDALCKTLEGAIDRIDDGEEKDFLKSIVLSCSALPVSGKMLKLLEVLERSFKRLESNKYPRKAIVFIDNKTTQNRLCELLTESGYGVLSYSGKNSRDYSIIERFGNDAAVEILVATDDVAKGVDMEFCPMVINYDMLYNAVEIEQRIARCHRQGQSSDTLVVNLVCKENFADVRIIELINKRVLQFGGIFGLSDSILGNFDKPIDEVLSMLRPRRDIEVAFADNLSTNKAVNSELVERFEDSIFSTFTEEVASKVKITPDYAGDKIEQMNEQLWRVVSWYFESLNMGYVVDYEERTVTAPDGDLPELFYYLSGSRNRLYKSLRKYGMSPTFKPHSGRITLTSVLGRGVLGEVCCAKEGMLEVVGDVEPCTIGYYGITIKSRDGVESKSFYVYRGVTKSGKMLSEAECGSILQMPINCSGEKCDNLSEESYNSRIFVANSQRPHPLDRSIDGEEYLLSLVEGREGLMREHIAMMKRRMNLARTAQQRGVEGLAEEVRRAEKMVDEAMDRLTKIKADKQVKVLRSDLRKREEALFMDGLRLDVALEEQIKEFSSSRRFSVEILRHFLVEVK
ncbi:MAG: DEAD/DEAH box helicase [Rikenellaceae bacterium]